MNTTPQGAAMLLLFDIQREAIDEHDEWHTHEHMPERLSIPGFRRGTRWTRAMTGPRYAVVYEVEALSVLDGPAYRARLDSPTPWTTRMMAHYVGMRRTLCRVAATCGQGVGGSGLVVLVRPEAGRAEALERWIGNELLPSWAGRRGISGGRLLVNALPAPMTREQSLRGRDAAVPMALWITGYDADTLARLARDELAPARLATQGAAEVEPMSFALAHALEAQPPAA